MQETADMIRSYCDQKFKEELRDKMYTRLARDSLFEEEEKLGKSFFDWNVDECEAYFTNMKVDTTKSRSFRQTASWAYINYLLTYYREMFDYQMQQTGIFKLNPLRDKRFSSMDRSKNNVPVISSMTIERLGYVIHDSLDECEADFTELIIWLLYSGFYDYSEMVTLKKNHVDLEKRTAIIENRMVHLKPRCVELLKLNHMTEEYNVYRQTNLMLTYHDSYIWFPYRMTKRTPVGVDPYEFTHAQFEELSVEDVCKKISNRMVKLRKETNEYISYDMIYYLGIYEYLVERCGEDKTKVLLESSGNRGMREESMELKAYLSEYGYKDNGSSIDFYRVKHNLRQFIK